MHVNDLRSSPSTGRTYLSPGGAATRCVQLANVLCMRMLYLLLGNCKTVAIKSCRGQSAQIEFLVIRWIPFVYTEAMVCVAAWYILSH